MKPEITQDTWNRMMLRRQEQEISAVMEMNAKTEQFGLSLTREETVLLVAARGESLRGRRRVEFGGGILKKLIFELCDSPYMNRNDYWESLARLQDIFYHLKNETDDRMSDEEALHFLREQFDSVCAGDLDNLEDTCMERVSRAVRSGSRTHVSADGRGIYASVDEEERWDPALYRQVLSELTWE